MIEKKVLVNLEQGLQARVAAQFVKEANEYEADIYLEKDNKKINAKSIMGLMSLVIVTNESITLYADGEDEESAINHLTSFISRK